MDQHNHIVEVDLEQLQQSRTFYDRFIVFVMAHVVAIICLLLVLMFGLIIL